MVLANPILHVLIVHAHITTTQGGVNSLVGVAIAASLLPPVVNLGMCLAYGLVGNDGVHASATYFDIAGGAQCVNVGIKTVGNGRVHAPATYFDIAGGAQCARDGLK
jgi:hypothetical protein